MTEREKNERKERKAIADEVYADFRRRQEERRITERGWQLNMNFLSGNQYCDVNALGEIEEEDKSYFWQERRVFNYIAPIVDTRSAKLSRIRPRLAVRAASDDEKDRQAAKLASAILSALNEDCDMDEVISRATTWSETCGTAFYKIIWDSYSGSGIGTTAEGATLKEGRVRIVALSPFEIYPYSLSEETIENQPSIIHARAVSADDIFAAYGVKVKGRDVDEFALSPISSPSHSALQTGTAARSVKHDYEIVIERYCRPNWQYPDGRLTIVAGGELLFDGPLPYKNGENGERGYPFVKQCCLPLAGGFFGSSVVDRLIPVQRAYNAVKNRKHEFLNRISMGAIAVEEGSIDTDELMEDGLAPGKVLVYRQGGTPPEMLTLGAVPSEFTDEEQRLEEEFSRISGTNDYSQQANAFTSVTSATGLQLIMEQDDARLNVCYDQIKSALKKIGRQALRLYRQFAGTFRLLRYVGDNGELALTSFKGSDITSDDVVLEADTDLNLSPAQRRTVVYEMLDRGLFSDDDGNLSASVKNKILETLGYTGYSGARDIKSLHRERCSRENAAMMDGQEVAVKDYDDHAVHIEEHTACLLGEKLDEEQEKRISAHLNIHKSKLSEVTK